MFTVEVNDTAFRAKMAALPDKAHSALKRKITALAIKMDDRVVGKLSGPVLKRRSGALVRSIFWHVNDDAISVIGKVASSGDVKYAAIHEFGGVIKHPGGTAYIITQDGAVWVSNAKAETMANVKRTKAHDITMPERSFLRSTLADMKGEIESGIRDAVVQGVNVK